MFCCEKPKYGHCVHSLSIMSCPSNIPFKFPLPLHKVKIECMYIVLLKFMFSMKATHNANIFYVIFTLFTHVPFSTVYICSVVTQASLRIAFGNLCSFLGCRAEKESSPFKNCLKERQRAFLWRCCRWVLRFLPHSAIKMLDFFQN